MNVIEKMVERICEPTNSAIGISSGVFFQTNFFSTIQILTQQNVMPIVMAYTANILLNSNNSSLTDVKRSGTTRKRAKKRSVMEERKNERTVIQLMIS